jgi:glutathione S-transferase
MKLYDFHESGNGYKVRLLLSHLGISYERIELDILKGETRTPDFLAINPNGRIPTLVLDDGRVLSESNAILFYLAQGTDYWPTDRFQRAQVLQWMGFEQYSHEPFIATVRFWTFAGQLAEHEAELPERRAKGEAALDVMEQHLTRAPFFVGDCYSIADIALYAYTHVADEGGYDLAPRPAIRAWIERVASQSGAVAITDVDPR